MLKHLSPNITLRLNQIGQPYNEVFLMWQEEADKTHPRGLYFRHVGGRLQHIWPTPIDMVREFHETYRQPIADVPAFPDIETQNFRRKFIREEGVVEMDEAHGTNDLVAVADAIADTIYVCYGMALIYGIPIDLILAAAVQPSNMSKLDENGEPIFTENGLKVVKGPNFFQPEPKIREILIAHGWTPPD